MKEIIFYDANCAEWRYDGKRVYMVDAEVEMAILGEENDNGYGCFSLEDGLQMLGEYGYMDR